MGKQDGSTLVEVVISLLLTAVMVSAVFSVVLSAKQSGAKADRKLLGGESVTSLQDSLKGYQTDSASSFTTGGAGVSTVSLVRGPNSTLRCSSPNYLCAAGWNIHTPGIQEDHACGITAPFGSVRPSVGAVQDVYALQAGNHCLVCTAGAGSDTDCFLPKILRDPPYNGVIFYSVSGGGGGTPPNVEAGIYWDEP